MTCIAWDGKVLAGDRLGDWNGTRVRLRKVFRLKQPDGSRWLLGAAGDSDVIAAYIDWFTGKVKEKPVFIETASVSVLLVNERRQLFLSTKTLQRVRVYQRQFAVGSARGEALAAMLAGKGAADAVRIAARLELSVGMGVDVVRF